MRICGRNTSTLPAPAMKPSTSRLRSGPSGIAPVSQSPSPPTAALMRSMGKAAQLNTAWKIRNSTAASSTGPSSGCRTISSSRAIARLRSGSL